MRALDEFYEKNFPEFVALRTKVSKIGNNSSKENKTDNHNGSWDCNNVHDRVNLKYSENPFILQW